MENFIGGVSMGQKIKAQRMRLGLTQENLAKMMFTTTSAVSHYENDRVDIKLSTLKILCDALKITPNYLLEFRDESSEIADAYNRINSSEVRKVIMAQVKMVSENF